VKEKMTWKSKQAKKATKSSKRINGTAQPEEDSDTATTFSRAEAPQATLATPDDEDAVES
jgi:hypothetical protein